MTPKPPAGALTLLLIDDDTELVGLLSLLFQREGIALDSEKLMLKVVERGIEALRPPPSPP